jgi:hypothetical protein
MQLFGSAQINMQYAETVKNELQKWGHIIWMKYTGRRETLKNIEVIVLAEELQHRKCLNNSTMDREERLAYISK